ncbi:hypothetical protein BJX70DRAFT_400082 [Aspergillus crustosus]
MNDYILRLPDELLDSIISTACSLISEYASPTYAPAALCLVCRRFYHLAVPYLYNEISVDYEFDSYLIPGTAKDPDIVHSRCAQSPSLWPLCRRLVLHCEDDLSFDRPSDKRQLDIFLDFTKWFTGIKSFVLTRLGKQDGVWAILRSALENFPTLTELSLGGEYSFEMEMGQVLEALGDMHSSKIRTLALAGFSSNGGTSASKQLQAQAGTASFTALRLRSFMQTPQVLESLVRWPTMLESFDIQYTRGAYYSELGVYTQWDLNTLQPILAIHRTTLKFIGIGGIYIRGLAGFDVRDFPNLQELRLSEATTSPTHQNSAANVRHIPNLLAPRLRVFHWDLNLEDQESLETLDSFAQEQEEFLRAVGNEAIKAKCPLQTLKITYTPHDFTLNAESQYPWDRIDALDREFQPAGIRVCYNSPRMSRAQFLRNLKRMRGELMEESGAKDFIDGLDILFDA